MKRGQSNHFLVLYMTLKTFLEGLYFYKKIQYKKSTGNDFIKDLTFSYFVLKMNTTRKASINVVEVVSLSNRH